jgi:L-arabinose transport system ATP-binding protein
MDEVFRLCDAATVLRDGRHVETFNSLQGVEPGDLVSRMVGRSILDIFHFESRSALAAADPVPALEVRELRGAGLSESASFSVSAGEILGIFGLVGAGRTGLLRLLYGAQRQKSGSILLQGRPITIRSPRHAVRAGMVLCPEDRKKEGIVPLGTVLENINISARRHFSPLGLFVNTRRERANAAAHVARLAIKTPSLHQLIMNLSGGNQQKVILARWLSEHLRVILLDEPTRGIDVGAKSEIYSIIYDLAKRGIGVVAVSSELPEVMGISDRLLVMREGRIVANIPRSAPEFTPDRILHFALPVGAPSDSSRGAISA